MHLAIVLALVVSGQDISREKGSLSGTVVDSITGQALNKAAVSLHPITDDPTLPIFGATSDAKGQFVLGGVEPGNYHVSVERNGYLAAPYGGHRQMPGGASIKLTEGQAINGIRIGLLPQGVLAGTVRDSDGEPLEGVQVYLGQSTYRLGLKGVFRISGVITDDRGEYRFAGLHPGKYYIQAEPRRLVPPRSTPEHRHPERNQPTIYPGVADIRLATAVDVSAGSRTPGIDLTLQSRPTFHLSGRVVNGTSGTLQVVAFNVGATRVWEGGMGTRTMGQSGDFEFENVAPGSYRIEASTHSFTGSTIVSVADADIDGIRINLTPSGHVNFRTTSVGVSLPDSFDQIFALFNGRVVALARLQKDGKQAIPDLVPDSYAFHLNGRLPAGMYLKSVRAGDIDILTNELTILPAETVDVDVALASDSGIVTGIARNDDGNPIADAVVVLVPGERRRSDLFLQTASDQTGRYVFAGIAPGTYKVFAWDDIEPESWTDPAFIGRFERMGEQVVLEPKGLVDVNPRVAKAN